MIKLEQDQYESVRDLFDGLWYHLNLFAVIEGKCRGQVFADDVENPRTALIWEQVEGNCYLAGDYTNADVVSALRSVFNETIVPTGKTRSDSVELLVNWYPDEWADHFDVILGDLAPLRHLRKHFIIDSAPRIDWRANLPRGYEMRLVDDELLARDELVNIDELRDWGSSSHEAMKPLMGGGIGQALLYGEHIVSWCMGDYAAGDAVEIGIHTDEAYRRKGLAAFTTAAMVETCLNSGAATVGWHCWSSNEASARTALKVGFRQTIEHPIYHAWYNNIDNHFVRGNMLKLAYDDPDGAVKEYTIAFRMIDEGHADLEDSRFAANWLPWAHFNMAKAAAITGETTLALNHLHQAVDLGYGRVEELAAEPELAAVRESDEWDLLMEKVASRE